MVSIPIGFRSDDLQASTDNPQRPACRSSGKRKGREELRRLRPGQALKCVSNIADESDDVLVADQPSFVVFHDLEPLSRAQ